jgi:hypothetical protein
MAGYIRPDWANGPEYASLTDEDVRTIEHVVKNDLYQRPRWAREAEYKLLTDDDVKYISTLPDDAQYEIYIPEVAEDPTQEPVIFTLEQLKQNVAMLSSIAQGIQPSLDLKRKEVEELMIFSEEHARTRDGRWRNPDFRIMSNFDYNFFAKATFDQLKRAYYVAELAGNEAMSKVVRKHIAINVSKLSDLPEVDGVPVALRDWMLGGEH